MKKNTIIDFDIKGVTLELLLSNNNYKHTSKLTDIFICKDKNRTVLYLDEDRNLLTLNPESFKKGLFSKVDKSEFYRYNISEKVKKIERSKGEEDNNMFILTENGNIYAYGVTFWMDEYGTLGTGKYIDNISQWIKDGCPEENLDEFTCITKDIDEHFIDIQTFASGFVALSENGTIWGTYKVGYHYFGEKHDTYKARKFRMIYDEGKNIKEIATGYIGFAYLTIEGDVYISGISTSGDYSQSKRIVNPKKLNGKYAHIYGSNDIILMDTSNKLYGGDRHFTSLLNSSYNDDNRFFSNLQDISIVRYKDIKEVKIKGNGSINKLVNFTLKDGTEKLYLMDTDDTRGININV
jgi:hypothetical protein